jgi:hypothetical protein
MSELTPFQLGLLAAIEQANFGEIEVIEAPVWIRIAHDRSKLSGWNQGVEYGYGLHKMLMERLTRNEL